MSDLNDSNNITIADVSLDELRCSLCTNYLASPPILLLPDGTNICGTCKPPQSQKAYRNSNLEAILIKVTFPCKYQPNGCEERLKFGEANEHDSTTCIHRSFPCPDTECSWDGPIKSLPEHFTANHSNRILEKTEFKLDVEKNEDAMVMVIVETVPLILKYQYIAAARELYYEVRYFKAIKEASCKLWLINNADHDYKVCIEGNECQAYDFGFTNPEFSNMLTLGNNLPLLNQPKEVIVGLEFNLMKEADSLIQCRWKNCPVMKEGDGIKKHEKKCKKRFDDRNYCRLHFDNVGFDYLMKVRRLKEVEDKPMKMFRIFEICILALLVYEFYTTFD